MDISRDKILAANPKIDAKLTRAYEELEQQLKRLGVDLRPKYTPSPPLGARPCLSHDAAPCRVRGLVE